MGNHYDLIVIGGGPGGYPAAIRAAKAGKRVAVAEAGELGGTCLNRGCIPTKTLLHTAETYREASSMAPAGLLAQGLTVDMPALMAWKREVVENLRGGIALQFKTHKIDLYPCMAQAAGDGRVILSGEPGEITGDHILVAAGSEPAVLPVPGLGDGLAGVEDSTSLLCRETLYDHLVIVGGGVIGMEFASFYTSLGRRVTVLEAADRILPGMDREISQNLRLILKKRGADIRTGAALSRVEKDPAGGLRCFWQEKGKEESLSCDGLLVAVGRRGLAEGAFAPECREKLIFSKGYVQVDEHFATGLPGVWAVGDATGGIQLAHMATAQGYRALREMFGEEAGPDKDLTVVPSCVYTDPEIASVGLTADEAKAAGIPALARKYLMSANGKSVLTRQERGFVKLVAHAETGRLLGAQLMCARATDIIGEAALAISRGLTLRDVAETIHPHPTFCEGFGEAAE